jgi:glycosyltransferase involved in cell wall biosynthesis
VTPSIRILFIHHGNDLYGADQVLLTTVRSLDRTKYAAQVVIPLDCKSSGGLAEELGLLGIPCCFLDFAVIRRRYFTPKKIGRFLYRLIFGTRHLCDLIEAEQIAIVHSNTLAVCVGAFAARLKGVYHVWHIHEMLINPRIVRKFLHFLATRFSDRLICISRAVKEHLLEDQPGYVGKMIVVHNGLSLSRNAGRDQAEAIRLEWSVPFTAPVVGMVGRINHWKGQAVLVRAAKLVLQQFPDTYFVAVGSVFADEIEYLNALEREIVKEQLGDRFLLPGFRKDISPVFAAMDIYVHPSLLPEPFGLVVIEAMAAGKAVVATAHGGPCEIIEDGVSGYLIEPNNPQALAEKINLLLGQSELKHRIEKAGKRRVDEVFSVERYMEELEEVYETLST